MKEWYNYKTPQDEISHKYRFYQGWEAALRWVLGDLPDIDEIRSELDA